ncbi:hypothetical protein S83_063223, partial [Arachis hypogaea]
IQESDEARKKFSNAKSLSYSQFFGDQNKAADVADQATLSKFSELLFIVLDVYYVSLHPDFCFRMRTFSFKMRTLEFKSSTQIRIYISIIKSEGLEISQPALDPQLSERSCCPAERKKLEDLTIGPVLT